MFKINLVPEVQQQKQALAKKNTYATIFAITIASVTAVTLIIMGSVKVAQTVRLNNTNNKIAAVKEESEQYKELEDAVLSLEAGLSAVKQILGGQNEWSPLFTHLENATPSDVKYQNINVEGNRVTAKLDGKTIDSLARFINSYKSYQIITLKGSGQPGEDVEIQLNSQPSGVAKTNNEGQWSYSVILKADDDHQIIINKGDEETSLSYSSSLKTITTHTTSISASVVNVFTDIETSQYTKENNNIVFDTSFSFASEALW